MNSAQAARGSGLGSTIGGQRQIMTALQQRIRVALSLGLLDAILGCDLGDWDLGDEVVVTLQRRKILFGELTPLRADLLENNLLGLGSHLRL